MDLIVKNDYVIISEQNEGEVAAHKKEEENSHNGQSDEPVQLAGELHTSEPFVLDHGPDSQSDSEEKVQTEVKYADTLAVAGGKKEIKDVIILPEDIKDVQLGDTQPKIPSSGVLDNILFYMESASSLILAELRTVDVVLSSNNCTSLSKLNPDLTRKLLTEHADFSSLGKGRKRRTAFQTKLLQDYVFIHGLVKTRDVLLNCNYKAALHVITNYSATHQSVVKGSYKKLIELLQNAVSQNELHPRIKAVIELIQTLFDGSILAKILVLFPRYPKENCLDLINRLKRQKIRSSFIASDKSWETILERKKIVILAYSDQEAFNFPSQHLNYVIFYERMKEVPDPGRIAYAALQSKLPRLLIGQILTEETETEMAKEKKFVVAEKSFFRENPSLAQKLKHCGLFQFYERDYNSLSEFSHPDIMIDPQTSILVINADILLSGSIIKRIYSSAIKSTRCLVLLKDPAGSGSSVDIEDVQNRICLELSQLPTKWETKIDIRIFAKEEHVFEAIQTATSEQNKDWIPHFSNDQEEAEAGMISQFDFFNAIVANIVSKTLTLQDFNVPSWTVLEAKLPSYIPVKFIMEAWKLLKLDSNPEGLDLEENSFNVDDINMTPVKIPRLDSEGFGTLKYNS